MAILKKEDLFKAIQEKLTDSDDDLTLLENITDTINDMTAEPQEDWKARYEENDKQWRERYKARFAEPSTKQSVEEKSPAPEPVDNTPKSANITIDDLFKE